MTTRNLQPRSTPSQEWLERQIGAWWETYRRAHYVSLWKDAQEDLAAHLHGNWLQVESLEVEMLVRTLRQYVTVSTNPELRDVSGWGLRVQAEAALVPFEKP